MVCVCVSPHRVQLSSSYASLRQAANEFSYFPASSVGIVAHGVARLAAALKVRHSGAPHHPWARLAQRTYVMP